MDASAPTGGNALFRRLTPPAELAVLAGLLLLFLAVNLPTLSRSPVVWPDEVEFVDPGAHLVAGEGYHSTAWLRQKRDRPFVAQVPAYPLLMAGWVGVFGVTPTGARSLNVVLMLGVAGLLWVGLRRSRLLRSPWLRLAAVVLVLGGAGVTFAYRGGRYDPLALLLVMGMFAASTAERRWVRLALVGGLGLLAPWSALPLLPFLLVAGGLLLLLARERAHREAALAAWAGAGVGVLSLWAVFSALDVWRPFLKCVNVNASLSREGLPNLPAEHLAAALHEYPGHLISDPSAAVLLLGMTLLLLVLGWRQQAGLRSLPAGVTLLGLVIPLALPLAGKYALYYAWMIHVPLAVGLLAVAEGWEPPGRRVVRVVVGIAAATALAVGLPARLAVTVAQWELRDPRPLDELAARHLTDADWVYCDWAGYYAARAHAGEVFLYAYRTQLTPSEKADIDALLIRPEQLSEIRFWIGGEWEAVERHTPVPRVSGPLGFRAAGVAEAYELTLYRRAEPPVPSVEPR